MYLLGSRLAQQYNGGTWEPVSDGRKKSIEYIQCMNDAGNITQNRQQNVDQDIGTASTLKEDTKRWQDDGEDDFEQVAALESSSV